MRPASSTRSAASMTATPRPTRWRWRRQRGITIKSAVVSFVVDDVTVNLIDTPGHPDFIAEVERVLSVLDGAVLVISAVEGVQAQTRVLMRALQRLQIPTLIFINKIDRGGARDRPRAREHCRETDAGHHRRWDRRSALGTRERAVTPFGAADVDFTAQAGRAARRPRRCAPGRLRRRRRRRSRIASSAARLRRRPGRRWCIRCSSARRSPAPGVDALIAGIRELLPARRRRRRRPGFGHRVQGRTRSGRREDRLCADVLGNACERATGCNSAGTGQAKVTAISVFDRGAAVPRGSVAAGQIGKLWGLGDIQIGDAIGAAANGLAASLLRPADAGDGRRSHACRPTRARCTPRSPSLPSRTR